MNDDMKPKMFYQNEDGEWVEVECESISFDHPGATRRDDEFFAVGGEWFASGEDDTDEEWANDNKIEWFDVSPFEMTIPIGNIPIAALPTPILQMMAQESIRRVTNEMAEQNRYLDN